MKKAWVWIMTATLIMAVGAFGSVFGEWKTVTMANEEMGIGVEYSVPASAVGETEEEFEEGLNSIVQFWFVGDEEEPELMVFAFALSGEFADFLFMLLAADLEDEDIEIIEETYIEIGGISSRMVHTYEEEEFDDDYDYGVWQWMAFVPEIPSDAGTFGLVMMVMVTDEFFESGRDAAMKVFNSIRF